MPDLWDSGPSLPPPGGPEHDGPDRLSPNARGQSADATVQHIDGGAYRTGNLPAGTAPFPFEQAERGLDGKLAGIYGESAVPAVRQALRGAVAAEGDSAYDRLGSDPGAFGEVRGDTAGVERLGQELRAVDAYRAQCVRDGYLVSVEAPPAAEVGATHESEARLDRDPDIPREHLAAWRALAQTPMPPSVQHRMDRMNEAVMDRFQQRLESRQEYVPAPSLWRQLDVREAAGGVVNLDYYAVRVRLPEGTDPAVLLNHVRKNLNDFVDTDRSSFRPFSDRASTEGNVERWLGDGDPRTPDRPLGSFVTIDVPGPNNASVAVVGAGRDHWTFATVQSPAETDGGDGLHPVSGHRRFGYTDNGDGTVTFYTRGVDRITDPITQGINAVTGTVSRNSGIALEGADDLWQSFQQGIARHVRSIGGAAAVERPVIARPQWSAVEGVLTSPGASSGRPPR